MQTSRRVRSSLSGLLVFGTLACLSAARAEDLYKCPGENGVPEFKNNGSTKGCVKISADPVVIPKYVPPGKASGGAAPASASVGAGFPKVDNVTQKARDSDRRRILEDELRDKQSRLADLRREYNNGEPERQGNERNYQRYLDRVEQLKGDIARTETDIASIKSEIDRTQ